MSEDREDPITQAVQVLNNLATLKIKVQELRSDAMQVRSQIDILFSDEIVSEEQINSIKEGFKVLKNFAQLNMKFLDARSQAENARQVLDEALKSPNSDLKTPIENVSAIAEPEAIEPVAIDSPDVESVDVEPVDVEPVDVEPVDVEPVDVEPVDVEPENHPDDTETVTEVDEAIVEIPVNKSTKRK